MANVMDYLNWRGDLSFKQSGVNEVDNILFVFLCFLDFDGIVPSDPREGSILLSDAVKQHFESHADAKPYYGALMPNEDIIRMARLMAKSNRFGNARLTAYVNEIGHENENETQFSAYTAMLDDGSIFISFKGTDDTLAGWKEDLNMAFNAEVSGQRRSVEYLTDIAANIEGKIRIGGHSKGGNFAVYAASKCTSEVQARISRVYNNDGPGFSKEFFESEGYLNIKQKVLKLIPQESVVGLLLTNDEHFTVIHSAKSGVVQHNSYLWAVRGRHFVRRNGLEKKSIELSNTINAWIEDKDYETRRLVIEAVYEMMTASSAETLTDIAKNRLALLKSLKKVDPQKKDMVFKVVLELVGDIIKSTGPAKQLSKKKSAKSIVQNNEIIENKENIEGEEEK